MQSSETKARRGKRWFAVSGLFLLCFFVLLYLVAAHKTQVPDQQITDWFVAHRSPGLNTLMEAVTHSGDWETTTCLCLILLAFPKYRIRIGVPVTAAALITTAVKAIVKISVDRPRPAEILHLITQGGYSFPSGHAITSVAVYLLLGVLLWHFFVREAPPAESGSKDRKLMYQIVGAACLVAAFIIGLSRVYVGVHFLSDVLAGWCFGIATFAAIYGAILCTGYDDDTVKAWLGRRFPKAGDTAAAGDPTATEDAVREEEDDR